MSNKVGEAAMSTGFFSNFSACNHSKLFVRRRKKFHEKQYIRRIFCIFASCNDNLHGNLLHTLIK